jgi:hypothetical protein
MRLQRGLIPREDLLLSSLFDYFPGLLHSYKEIGLKKGIIYVYMFTLDLHGFYMAGFI